MVEHVAEQAAWFLPQLNQLLHSSSAAFLPTVPVASYLAYRSVPDGDDLPWPSPVVGADRGSESKVLATIAITEQEHRMSEILVSDRYAWRGYCPLEQIDETPREQREVTLLAWSESDAVGTMTMGIDNGRGLQADETYAEKLDDLRAQGRTVCEFTRFAVSAVADSKATISGLFDLSYVLGRRMLGVTDVVVEVNPRHVGFYRRAFGFKSISDVRTCERVNAPAVLLRLDVAELEGRMRQVGARMPGELATARG